MDNTIIMVSVIMLTYNHKKYISQAVESVLMQKTNFQYEILICDDASTDGTDKIILDYARRYSKVVRVIVQSKNMGATHNLYTLQVQAKGKYIAYLEGDDYWCDRQKLQKQRDFLKTHPEFIACTHRCTIVRHDGLPYKNQHLRWISEKEKYTIDDFRGIVLPGHMSTLMHRNLFIKSTDFYQELVTLHPMVGDRSMALLLASQGDIYQLRDNMSCYRAVYNREESATGIFYLKNQNWVRDDFELTCKLERYATNYLQVNGRFERHKNELFVDALYVFIKRPTNENFQLIEYILSEGTPFRYWVRTPWIVIQKCFEKLQEKKQE